MNLFLETIFHNFTSPAFLCFGIGLLAAFLRSDLEIPEILGKSLALYLMLAIGLKGGVSLSEVGLNFYVVAPLLGAIFLSFSLPFLAYNCLRITTHLDRTNRAAIGAHYGSVSLVTFAAATDLLETSSIPYEGIMTAMLALMETPALISGLWLSGKKGKSTSSKQHFWRDVLVNGSLVLLMGGFMIGLINGTKGIQPIAPFFMDGFKGALCLFLLDMGLLVARRLQTSPKLDIQVIFFGFYMPFLGALLGGTLGYFIGFSVGGVFLLMVLGASASYIAVPAAIRLAIPSANPAYYITLSLGITFPFNITLGIPVYFYIAERLFS